MKPKLHGPSLNKQHLYLLLTLHKRVRGLAGGRIVLVAYKEKEGLEIVLLIVHTLQTV